MLNQFKLDPRAMFNKYLLGIACVAVVLLVWMVMPDKVDYIAHPVVSFDTVDVPVEIAQTPTERARGLSGRLSLAEKNGMLFVFPRADIYRFWMPDMHFPLDILWIDNDRVVDIHKNVSADFDPKNPKFYRSQKPALYVLEVNAGFADARHIQVGDKALFRK